MTETYLAGCLHFGHDNLYKFKRPDGELLRPFASNSEEGDEIIIETWNEIVRPDDRVYLMGDVSIPRRGLKKIERLNGRKALIGGNHDIFKLKDYVEYFDYIKGSHKLDRFILSHIPLHPLSIPKWCRANIHAHIHAGHVMIEEDGVMVRDHRYFNTCLEETGFKPISFGEIKSFYAQLDQRTGK